ncbi:MAG: hypothetical protein M3Q56_01145 [Bacteroidota bacterium]|nr:hypothetical protein [Bacteroidota bacterium]
MNKSILFLFIVLGLSGTSNAQSGVAVGVGLSLGQTHYDLVNRSAGFLTGWHASISGRLWPGLYYFRPGIELHRISLVTIPQLDPFTNIPSVYLIKVPLQGGVRLVNIEHFELRTQIGLVGTYAMLIEDNDFGLNYDTIEDYQLGALFGLGIDIGPITLDVSREISLTQFYHDQDDFLHYWLISAGLFF